MVLYRLLRFFAHIVLLRRKELNFVKNYTKKLKFGFQSKAITQTSIAQPNVNIYLSHIYLLLFKSMPIGNSAFCLIMYQEISPCQDFYHKDFLSRNVIICFLKKSVSHHYSFLFAPLKSLIFKHPYAIFLSRDLYLSTHLRD